MTEIYYHLFDIRLQFPISPPPISSHYCLSFPAQQSTPPPFLLSNRQVFPHGHQQIMAYQVAIRLSISPCVKAEHSDPIQGVGRVPKANRRFRDSPWSHVSSPIREPSYTIVTSIESCFAKFYIFKYFYTISTSYMTQTLVFLLLSLFSVDIPRMC